MVIIHGETRSGKSSKALSLIDKDGKSIYFALDFDKSIYKWAQRNKNIKVDVEYINKYFEYDIEFDIEFAIFEKGVVRRNLTQLIVDPINTLVKRGKNNLQDVIDKLKSIEDRYGIEVIAVMNTSFYVDEIEKIQGCKVLETKKISKKEISLVPAIIGPQYIPDIPFCPGIPF